MAAAAMLDHVALRVVDRDATAQELLDRFDVRVIERTERFTLIGVEEAAGKLTLLDAEGDVAPDPARIVSLVLAEPEGSTPAPVRLRDGIVVTFAEADAAGAPAPRHSLVGVSLRSLDPPIAAAQLERLHGMRVASMTAEFAVLEVGSAPGGGRITLTRERWARGEDAPSALDHVGIKVADAEAWHQRMLREDADVVRWVEAPHSKAVFVAVPDGLLVEFVEQTRPFVSA